MAARGCLLNRAKRAKPWTRYRALWSLHQMHHHCHERMQSGINSAWTVPGFKAPPRAEVAEPGQENGMLGRLPMEILRLILNGGPSLNLRTHRPRDRGFGAHLDRRWRFAARATCHLWRTIIEHPTQSEACIIGWRKIDFNHRATKCPKWSTGRIVCASIIADWIRWTVSAWDPYTADQIFEWCRYMAPDVSRKHVIVALVASMVPGAIEHAIRVEWERVLFTVNDELVTEGRRCGLHDYWDDDVRGDSEGLCKVLIGVIGGRARTLTSFRLIRQRYGDCDDDYYVSASYLLHQACQAGNGTLVRLLLEDDPLLSVGNSDWEDAAGARDPSAFVHLLYRHRQKRPRVADPFTSKACHEVSIRNAVNRGRWEALAACDRYGIAFDDSKAFARAALVRHVRLMAWLWDRAKRRGRCHEIDVFDAAVCAMTARNVGRPHKSIEWLCNVAGYVPHASAPGRTINALVGRSDRTCAQSLMYGLSVWPRSVCAGINVQTLERAFVACAGESLEMAHAFLARLDRHASDHGLVAGPDGFDGWALLMRPRDLSEFDSYGPDGSTLELRQVLAFMRIARRAAHGCHPLRRDVAECRENAYGPCPRVCSCSIDPQWSHDPHRCSSTLPFAVASVYGIDDDDDAMVHQSQVPAKKTTKRARKATGARVCPPTEAVKQLTYLVGKWCAPRPVSLSLLFPGWVRPPRQSGYRGTDPNGRERWRTPKDRAIEIADWLECVGLLHSDPLSTP